MENKKFFNKKMNYLNSKQNILEINYTKNKSHIVIKSKPKKKYMYIKSKLSSSSSEENQNSIIKEESQIETRIKSSESIKKMATKEIKLKIKTSTTTDKSSAKILNSPRFFSNLNPKTLKHEPGNIIGSASLVAGTTVGAGILALPAITEKSGFIPSSIALGSVCLFSILTGLLIAEVNLNTMCELGFGGVSLNSMAERTLGKTGSRFSSFVYIFLHYALLVAYISRGGDIVAKWSQLPIWMGDLIFCLCFGSLCFFSNSKVLDKINGALVTCVILSFLVCFIYNLSLVVVTYPNVDVSILTKSDWSSVSQTLSIISLAFVYHNIVPVIVTNLEGDKLKIQKSIVFGSLIPLIMFITWDAVLLGSTGKLRELTGINDPLSALRASSNIIGPLVEIFSIFALATSFIGFVLGLTDFISDLLKLPSRKQILPYGITLLPPSLFALSYPDVFFKALDVAGTYGVLVLFGCFPVLMAWSERYNGTTLSSIRLVFGEKWILLLIGSSASLIILKEFIEIFN